MNSRVRITNSLLVIAAIDVFALVVLLVALGGGGVPVRADPGVLYVSSTCSGAPSPCYTTIQEAVDAASSGDEIHIAQGTYTGVRQRAGITQVVYITKDLTLLGGWNGDFTVRDPSAYPAIVDAQGLGRGIVISGPVTATLDGLKITGGNAAGLKGGYAFSLYDSGSGLYIFTATVALSDCLISGNVVSPYTYSIGGGIYAHKANLTIQGGRIYTNVAWYGGGIALWESRTVMTGTVVDDNAVVPVSNYGGCGGGLYFFYGGLTGSGLDVVDNEGATGGGLCLDGTRDWKATLQDTKIHHNRSDWGGGLMVQGIALTITRSYIYSNTATGDGGGLWNGLGDVLLSDCAIHHNRAGQNGGGGYGNSLRLVNDDVYANVAREGGGIYSPILEVTSSKIHDNVAREGGGVYGGLAACDAVHIADNTAGWRGGGLYLERGSTCRNVIIAKNILTETTGQGAGGYLVGDDDAYRFLHTTLVSNTGGDGVGLFVTNTAWYAGQVRFTNTIVAGHAGGTGIWAAAGSTVTLAATLWYANGAHVGGPGSVSTGTVNIYADPEFTGPGAGDYHLTYGSPAVDAGVDAGVTSDIDDEPRPAGAAPDLGADEYPYGLSLTPMTDSATVNPGGWHIYHHTIQNIGVVTDAYTLTVASSRGWTSLGSASVVTLSPGDTADVLLLAQVPADAPGLAREVAVLIAVSHAASVVSATAVDTTTVSCTPPAGAAFTWSPAQPETGETVQFTGTVASGSSPLTYTWAFGDGGDGQGKSVAHTYTQSGTYTVRLTVTNPCGFVSAADALTVTGGAVTPRYAVTLTPITRSTQVAPGGTAVYTHTLRNTGNVADTYTVTLTSSQGWARLAGGGTADIAPNLAPQATAVVTVEVAVPVTASAGAVEVATVEVTSWAEPTVAATAVDTTTVSCTPPAGAAFTWSPAQPETGATVQFTGTVASGSSPLTYTWAFGDGGDGQGKSVAHTYTQSGTYTVRLTVTNPCGFVSAADALTITGGAVTPRYAVTLTPITRSAQVAPGGTAVYTHTLRNVGNVADTYTVTLTSSQGWAGLVGGGTVNLAPQSAVVVTVVVAVPPTATAGKEDVAVVKAVSWAAPELIVTAVDTTTVVTKESHLYLPLVLRRW